MSAPVNSSSLKQNESSAQTKNIAHNKEELRKEQAKQALKDLNNPLWGNKLSFT